MGNAASTFPMTLDTLNAAYDPDTGPAVMAMQNFYGGYTGPASLTSVVAQSFPDEVATSSLTVTAGTVFATIMTFAAGTVIKKISVVTAVTAASTPTNQWAGIATVATTAKVVAISTDGLTAAVAADSVISFALATAYVIPVSGQYYVFFCIAATTGPTVAAAVTLGGHGRGNVAPFLSGPCATGQTTPPAVAATLTQPTAAAAAPLVYISNA